MQQQVFTEGEQQALTRNAFTREGYTFSGWNGNGANYIDGQMITVTSNMTLYAQWTSNSTPSGGSGDNGSGGGYTPSNGQISGHEYVDLGLPSGTLWATCNVGANIPSGTGYYYAWGETAPKTQYNSDNYLYNDNSGFLPATADAATVNWGGGWRTPTYQEMEELLICSKTCTKQNDMNGILITGYNGNSIFLPAAGYRRYDESADWDNLYGRYWTSSCENGHAAGLYFELYNYSSGIEIDDLELEWLTRFYGMSIRPVWTSSVPTFPIPTVTTEGYSCNWEFSGNEYYGVKVVIYGNYQEFTCVTTWGFRYGTNINNLSNNIEVDLNENSVILSGLAGNTTYYYQAYATNSAGTGYGEVKQFTTPPDPPEPGSLNGHVWVDLGLPSGTRWATCNVGATNPEDYGDYYAWGETSTKSSYTADNYTYSSTPTTLPSSADAATANWGSGWRMPTSAEMQELIYNCTETWTTQNGVNGRLFTGPNGNSIFLPAAGYRYDSEIYDAGYYGYYWSSSLGTDLANYAWLLYFHSSGCYMRNNYYHFNGRSVRAVCTQ